MNPENFCKCSGILVFKEMGFGRKIEDLHAIDFIFTCPKCKDTVIHSRVPTLAGYITARVENIPGEKEAKGVSINV